MTVWKNRSFNTLRVETEESRGICESWGGIKWKN